MPYIELPNKAYFKVPEGLTDEEALGLAKQRFPFLYESQGIVGRGARALGRGFEELGESAKGIALGARTAMGDTEYGQRAIQEQKAAAIEEAKKPQALSVKQLEDIWKMQGIGSALSHVPSYITEQILQNAPSMATPLAAGAAGTAFGGPLAGLAAGIGTYGLQQYGQFMQRQAATPGRTGETFEPGKAAATAAVTAPLGFLVDRFTLGLGKIPEKAAAQLILKEIAARKTGETLARGAFRGLSEMPTEVLEQAAERYQAGLSLTDAEAKAEYKEAAAGALAVGAVGGAGSAYRERGKAQEFVEMQNLLDKAKQQQAAQQAQQKQKAFEALPPQTQPDIFGEVAGAFTPVQGTALPVGQSMQELYAQLKKAEADGDTRTASILRNDINRLTAQLNEPTLLQQRGAPSISLPPKAISDKTKTEIEQLNTIAKDAQEKGDISTYNEALKKIEQLKNQPIVTEAPEVSLQEEYRKIKAEANRLGSIVEAAKEQKNIPAYNAALKKLEQLDAAQSQIIKLAKEQNIILDVDSELAKAKAAADRYMNKDKPVPDALANSLQTLQTEKQRQLQQQAGTLDKTFDPTLQQIGRAHV